MGTGIAYVNEMWNPVCGCTKCNPGCLNCYAEDLHTKRHKAYLAGKKMPKQYAKPFNEIQLFSERLNIPLHWRKPRRILVSSIGDLFHKKVPFEFIDKIFTSMLFSPQHTFLVLTKRPKRMLYFIKSIPDPPFPTKNIYLGATISNQKELNEKMPIALQISGFDWISFEPLLSNIKMPLLCKDSIFWSGLKWAVIGCESGPKRRLCKLEHIRSIVEQCKAANNTKVFVKQMEINGKVCHDPKLFPIWAREREVI